MLIYFAMLALLAVIYGLSRYMNVTVGENGNNISRSRGDHFFLCAAVLFLGLVMGLRASDVGADTLNYMLKYESYAINGLNTEILYEAINIFFSSLGVPWQVFLLIISFFISACLAYFIDSYSRNLLASVYLFITVGLFQMYMTGLRQSLAISICLVAIVFLNKGYSIRFLLLVLVASLFHNSAIVVLLLLPIRLFKLSLSYKGLFALIAVCVGVYVFRSQIISLVNAFLPLRYTNTETYDLTASYQINPLVIMMNVAIPVGCLIICGWKRGKKIPMDLSFMYQMSAINILFIMLSANSFYLGRLSYYFVSSHLIIVPDAMASVEDSRVRTLLYMFFALLGMLVFVMSVPGNSLSIDNYHFFFQ